jgi:nickel/cobalt exporter
MPSMQGLAQILFGSLALSLIHAVIPNHWMPLVAVGKTENWSRQELWWATAITGAAHTASTILIGLVIGFFGYKLAANYDVVTRIVAPLILISLGIVYLIADIRGKSVWHHHHHHEHENHYAKVDEHPHIKQNNISMKETLTERSKLAILAPLGTAMFFSPCIEIEAYYFAAGSVLGWFGILIVSSIYFTVTVFGMLLFVEIGRQGMQRLETKLSFLEHHEQALTGVVLILSGAFAHFVEI